MANPSPAKPFTKGDSRINRKGRPRSFDALRALAQEIAHKELTQKDGSLISVTEAILSGWAASKDARLQMQFIDVAFGKVPTPIENEHKGKITHEIIVRRGKALHRLNRAAPGTDESDSDGEAIQLFGDGPEVGEKFVGR